MYGARQKRAWKRGETSCELTVHVTTKYRMEKATCDSTIGSYTELTVQERKTYKSSGRFSDFLARLILHTNEKSTVQKKVKLTC